MSDHEKNAELASKIVNSFASVCNKVVTSEEDSRFTDVASSIIAGAIQFTVKSMVISGFSKEEIIKSVSAAYDQADKHDPDVHRARLLRSLLETMGDVRVQ
jgi:ATP/ADP translocase